MGGNPWDRNEGKFDVPSSSPPRFVRKGKARRFEPTPDALARFGAAATGLDVDRGVVLVGVELIADDPRAYHGVESARSYSSAPGKRIKTRRME
jgi:hypothetical protein